jgi:predicted nucleic acid-binding protein
MTEAVVDAGPLIHLAELNALDVLHDLTKSFVPNAVWEEVENYQPNALKSLGKRLERVSVAEPSPDLQTLAQALSLDRGEVEALAFLETHSEAWFLTDDAAARLTAEQRGYQVHGTIGMLIRSVRRGQKEPRQVLTLLHDIPKRSTLFIRPGLLDTIISRLETEWLEENPR